MNRSQMNSCAVSRIFRWSGAGGSSFVGLQPAWTTFLKLRLSAEACGGLDVLARDEKALRRGAELWACRPCVQAMERNSSASANPDRVASHWRNPDRLGGMAGVSGRDQGVAVNTFIGTALGAIVAALRSGASASAGRPLSSRTCPFSSQKYALFGSAAISRRFARAIPATGRNGRRKWRGQLWCVASRKRTAARSAACSSVR